MKDIVLVHGAWQGASTWNPIVPALRDAGHRVFTPVLTGTGPRAYELSADVGLDRHVQDVLGYMTFEDLRDVVLVGHSYAGMVVTQAVEHCAERIAKLVYVDAFVPEDGQSAWDLLPGWLTEALDKQLIDGWRLPGFEKRLDLWGLEPGPHRDFVRTKLCDFPLRCFKDTVALKTHAATKLPRAYIASVSESYPARPAFEPFSTRAKNEGWDHFELDTGHDSHVEASEECVRILHSLAT
jgi:pimeloyl-ACP methyl ester carboxylesterase